MGQIHEEFLSDVLLHGQNNGRLLRSRVPQFNLGQNPANGLYVKFDKSPSGFHTSKDTALTIESLSEQYDTEIISVKADGMDADLSAKNGTVLKVGESCKIEFKKHSLPKSTEPFTVTVVYSLRNGQVPFVKSRTFTFTAMSDSEYDNYVFLSGKKIRPTARQTAAEKLR